MHDAPYRLIPLRNRAGETIAHTKVDVADYDWLNQWRWCLSRQSWRGYVERRQGSARKPGSYLILMHRQILGLEFGDPRQGDHTNGDRRDNRRSNLRIVTHAQNQQNIRQPRGTSSHRGVSWAARDHRWEAYAWVAGKKHGLGYYRTEQEAAAVAAAFRAERLPFAEE